eukprot:CFRG2464T1
MSVTGSLPSLTKVSFTNVHVGVRQKIRCMASFPSVFDRFKSNKIFPPYPAVNIGEVRPRNSVPTHIIAPHYAKTGGGSPRMGRIPIQTRENIEKIRKACELGRLVLNHGLNLCKAGTTTDEIDRSLHNLIISHDAYPSPLNYMGFKKSCCTSVNNIQVHGIPDTRPLQNGDIINLDVSVYVNGFHGDLSETVCVGHVDDVGRLLVETTRHSLNMAIKACGLGKPFSVIGETIDPIAHKAGFTVSDNFIGHGIGNEFHTPPNVLHHKNRESNITMREGMVFTIEPVLCEGSPAMKFLDDGWTAVSADGGRSAQFEHTVVITADGVEVLTL